MKVILTRGKCIGCGSCAAVCEKFFSMSDIDGLANLEGAKRHGENFELSVEDAECAVEAAEVCPMQIIKIGR
ncbi:MAG: 4Fe-4S ferredoxin iron-sulfur binding domain-containing protein [Parcubacteria group bacterium GW2011_GWF2_44_7]|nr:MAG: 4Fe-4S ferredoxin iron-sulfur binding domain-containing protein [Parcubacteria group bacterium GW2011_GWF2_44_7]